MLGARFDLNDTFEDRLSPRAGIVLKPYQGGTIKLLYGEGFRNPTQYDAFYDDNRYNAREPEPRRRGHPHGRADPEPRSQPDAASGFQWTVSLGGYYSRLTRLFSQEVVCVVSPDYRDEPNSCPLDDGMGGPQLDDRLQNQNKLSVELDGRRGDGAGPRRERDARLPQRRRTARALRRGRVPAPTS